jgi:hypothetical protein
MKRLLTLALLAALALPGTAAAKGPSKATITGPGLSEPVVLNGMPESDTGTRFGRLVEQGGWFQEVFRQSPDPTSAAAPTRQLGPRYDAVYVVPTGDMQPATIRQELYPFASGGPVTHLRAGQPIFGGTTPGGWYRSPVSLRATLVSLGLPKQPPSVTESALGAGAWAGIAAGCAALLAATAFVLRQRRGLTEQPGQELLTQ